MSSFERSDEIKDILKNLYNMRSVVPSNISGSLCLSTFNDSLDIVVSMPGHIDEHKWVVRFFPKMLRNGVYTDFGKFFEERFDSADECVIYLIENRADIYRTMYEFILEKYTSEVMK